jgi:hypothetical protein
MHCSNLLVTSLKNSFSLEPQLKFFVAKFAEPNQEKKMGREVKKINFGQLLQQQKGKKI